MDRRRGQVGVTLLELILVVGLISTITLISFYEKQSDLEQSRARQVGGMLFQYNNAVRSALAMGLVPATTTKSGTNWLKNSSCGGVLAVGEEFLPCDFPTATDLDPIKFGRIGLTTAIVVSGTAPNKKYKATTLTSPFTISGVAGATTIRSDLAGVAALSAAAAMNTGFLTAASNGHTPFTATTDSSYKVDPLTAKITIIASNTADKDAWLRADGGNKMHASMSFDGADPSDRTILGVSGIQNFAGEVLKIGSGSGLTPMTGSRVVIDSTAEVLGDFRIRRGLYVDNDLNVTGNINATGSVKAAANVEAGANVTSQGSVAAQGNVTSQAHMSAAGNVTAGGALLGQIFYDSNNNGYYVDPDATSNLNALAANNISSNGRVRAAEFVEVGGVVTEGAGCSPNGLLGRNVEGASLSCVLGIWTKSGGIGLTQQVSGICQPDYVSTKTCTLADSSWYCTLSGVSGAGEEEDGYVYLSGNQWYIYTARGAWPARYRWTCFK